MRKIAVTGGLASGKSSVCRILENSGAYVISADEIVHQLLSPNTALGQQVVRLLGLDVINNNALDRKKIAEIVFSHPEKLKNLEKLIHPAVFDEIERRYQQIKNQKKFLLFVAEIPLLYESEREQFFDAVIAVIAEPALSRKRFQQATGHPPEEYDRRMNQQLSLEQKASKADYTIVNNGDLEELKASVIKLIPTLSEEHHFR